MRVFPRLPPGGLQFFFGSSAFVMSSTCPAELAALHSPYFAGFMVQFTAALHTSPTFNATAFALGFGAHTMSDTVGFGFPTGYFQTTVAGGVDWLYTWPLMLNVDAYVFANSACGTPVLPTQPISAEGAEFIVRGVCVQ